MNRLPPALLVFAAFQVHAVACAKIEYVEARDWSPVQVEQAYCAAGNAATYGRTEARRLAVVEHEPYKAEAVMKQANACAEQQAMLARLLENVHKRQLPSCQK